MDGKIWAESVLGRGTTFHFILPVVEGNESEIKMEKSEVSLLNSNIYQSKPSLKILIAEDNKINQTVLLGFLEKLGFKADIAINGLIAIQMMQKNHYDLILMDCHMPELDGYAATKKIRKIRSIHQPIIIAITAANTTEDKSACIRAGMNDFISKPIQISELIKVLNATVLKVA